MKKFFLLSAALLCLGVVAGAQQRPPAPAFPEYTFTTVKALPITSIKNQASSGTCWSFSAVS